MKTHSVLPKLLQITIAGRIKTFIFIKINFGPYSATDTFYGVFDGLPSQDLAIYVLEPKILLIIAAIKSDGDECKGIIGPCARGLLPSMVFDSPQNNLMNYFNCDGT